MEKSCTICLGNTNKPVRPNGCSQCDNPHWFCLSCLKACYEKRYKPDWILNKGIVLYDLPNKIQFEDGAL